jgi:hypothetical protein
MFVHAQGGSGRTTRPRTAAVRQSWRLALFLSLSMEPERRGANPFADGLQGQVVGWRWLTLAIASGLRFSVASSGQRV